MVLSHVSGDVTIHAGCDAGENEISEMTCRGDNSIGIDVILIHRCAAILVDNRSNGLLLLLLVVRMVPIEARRVVG